MTEQELQEDIDVLNVVNFGGGSYVVYAEVVGDTIEVDPEPYGDNFARPARLLPLQAKALVAAIDLIGEHIPEGSLESARKKIIDALGQDPAQDGLQITRAKGDDSDVARVLSEGIVAHRLVEIEYYKENEDDFTKRKIEPYQLANGREGWYVVSYDLERDDTRTFRLDRIRSANVLDEGVRAARGRRGRHARLAAHRRGRGLADRADLVVARARALGARGQARGRGAEGRRRDRRAAVPGHRLARAPDPQPGRRRRRARARGGARRRPRGRRGARRAGAQLT